MNKLILVESLMTQYAEYRDARVIALKDCSCYLTDTVEAVDVTVLLETEQILHIFNAAKDDGKEYFIMNRVNEDPFYVINTWQDFLPNVDVLEWAQATKQRMVRCEEEMDDEKRIDSF